MTADKEPPALMWLSVCCLGLMFVAPFLNAYHPPPTPSFYSEWLSVTLGIIALTPLLGAAFWRQPRIPPSALWLLALIVVAVVQIPFVTTHYSAQALRPILYLAWAAGLITLTAWLRGVFSEERLADVLAVFLFAGSLLHATVGLIQYLGLPGPFGDLIAILVSPSIYGNVGQQNHYATQLMLGVVAVSYLFARGKISSATVIVAMPIFAFVLSLTTARAVILYSVAFLALSVVAATARRDSASKRFVATAALMLGCYLVIQLSLPSINQWLADSALAEMSLNPWLFSQTTALQKLSLTPDGITIRLTEWHKALLMVLPSPILGIGPENYAWRSFALQGMPDFVSIAKPEFFAHSHNIFMQVLVDYGVLGLLVLLAFLFTWWRQFRPHWHSPTGLFIALSLSILFIHANLELPLWYAYFLGIAAVFFGLGDYSARAIRVPTNTGRVVAALVLTFSMVIMVSALVAYRSVEQLLVEVINGQSNAQGGTILAQAARHPLVRPDAEIALTYFIAWDNKSTAQKLRLVERVTQYHPDWFRAYQYAAFLGAAGHVERASAMLKHAAKVYPLHLDGFIARVTASENPMLTPLLGEAKEIAAARKTQEGAGAPSPLHKQKP